MLVFTSKKYSLFGVCVPKEKWLSISVVICHISIQIYDAYVFSTMPENVFNDLKSSLKFAHVFSFRFCFMFFNDEKSGGEMVALMAMPYNRKMDKSLKTTYFPLVLV